MIKLKDLLEQDEKIICSKCGWKWNKSEGGKDPYVCHKCGYVSNPYNFNNKVLDEPTKQMIKLKPLLERIEAKWVEHAFELAWMRGLFPITPEIGKILNKGRRVNTFHITSIQKLDTLKSIQGSKKSISTTTKVPNSTINNGLMGIWENGVLFYLEGTLLVKGLDDIMSRPDNEGRRWIGFDYGDAEELWVVEIETKELRYRGREIAHMETGSKEQNEEIRKYLKDYIDIATKFAKKYRREILQYFIDKDNTYADWDELVVNEIKLIDVIWDTSYVNDYAPTAKTSKEKEIKKIEAKLKSMVSGEVVTVNQWKGDARGKIQTFSKKKTK